MHKWLSKSPPLPVQHPCQKPFHPLKSGKHPVAVLKQERVPCFTKGNQLFFHVHPFYQITIPHPFSFPSPIIGEGLRRGISKSSLVLSPNLSLLPHSKISSSLLPETQNI